MNKGGESIVNVIYQLEKKYVGRPNSEIKAKKVTVEQMMESEDE